MSRAFLACLTLLLASPLQAQSAEEFYAGKTVSLYIGSSPGAGYDAYGRLIARHIGKYIPGNPTVVPLNMEGAGGLRLANWLFEAAPQDGTAFGLLNRGTAFMPLLGERQFAQFDAKAFHWLGSATDDVSLCIAHARTGLTRFEQLFEQELVVGNTGPGADGFFMTEVAGRLLGANLRAVTGYAGGNEIYLAMEQGEVDGRCGLAWSALKTSRPQWLDDGSINILIQLGLRTRPELSHVPSVMDLPLGAEERQILRLIMLRSHFGRPFAAPPHVPPARAAALRAAFEKSLSDPELLEEAERLRIEIGLVSGEELHDLLAEAYDTPPELVERAREILN